MKVFLKIPLKNFHEICIHYNIVSIYTAFKKNLHSDLKNNKIVVLIINFLATLCYNYFDVNLFMFEHAPLPPEKNLNSLFKTMNFLSPFKKRIYVYGINDKNNV